jgi:hypothetical protein
LWLRWEILFSFSSPAVEPRGVFFPFAAFSFAIVPQPR